MRTSRLSLPEPCTVGWSNMLPTKNGQYCTSCSKVIPELHRMTDAAILEQFMQNSGDFCGRIAPAQIQRIRFDESALRAQVQVKQVQDSLLRRIIGGGLLALTFTTWNVTYAEKLPLTPTVIDQFVMDQAVLAGPGDTLTNVIIKGKVIDKTTGELLPFVTLYIEVNGTKYGCNSDMDGNYFLKVPGKFPVKSLLCLKAKSLGYNPIQIDVKLKSEQIFQNIEMEMEDTQLLEGIIIREED